MKWTIFCFSFFILFSFGQNNFQETKELVFEGYQNFISQISSIHKQFGELDSWMKKVIEKREIASQACVDAVTTYESDAFCRNFNAGDTSFIVTPAPFCTKEANCKQLIDDVLVNCRTATEFPAPFEFDLSKIEIFGLFCLTDTQGNYCLNTFTDVTTPSISSTNITDTSLDRICNPCFGIAVNYIFANPNVLNNNPFKRATVNPNLPYTPSLTQNTNVFLSAVCSKNHNNRYCLTSNSVFSCPLTDENCVNCNDRCLQIYAARIAAFLPQFNGFDFPSIVDHTCTFNPSINNYCFDKFVNDWKSLEILSCPNPSTCSSACENALSTFMTNMGCCLPTVLQAAEALKVNLYAQQIESCNISTPSISECGNLFGSVITKEFELGDPNFYNYPNLNDNSVIQALREDLASFFGLPLGGVQNVQISISKKNFPLVKVDFQSQSNAITISVGRSFDNELATQTIILPKTAAICGSYQRGCHLIVREESPALTLMINWISLLTLLLFLFSH